MRQKLGQLLFEIVVLAKDFRNPAGQRFSAVIVKELLMGRLADLLQRDKETKNLLETKVRDLTNSVGDLSKINAELTAQLGNATTVTVVKTPGGYTLDAADLAAVDAALTAAENGVPVPVPSNPTT